MAIPKYQIHEYMLVKAPPVPQCSPSQTPQEEHTPEREDEAQKSTTLGEDSAQAASEGLPNTSVGDDRIVEGVEEAPVSPNPNSVSVRTAREVPSNGTNNQLLQKPQARIQKSADDRLFTYAAVVLTLAIVVLLLKKYMKASGHGAVFMDGS